MTVEVEVPFVPYSGNGVTTLFPVPFEWLNDSELVVTLRVNSTGVTTTKVINVDYTVTGGDGGNGSITMAVAPAVGTTLTIRRDTPIDQGIDFQENGLVLLETIEEGFDNLTRILQEMAADIASGIQAPIDFDPNDPAYRMPHPEAGKVLVGTADETGWEHIDLADLETVGIPVVFTNLQAGDVLQYDGTNWVNAVGGGGFADPMTTNGDMITRAGGVPARVAIGAANTLLKSNGSAPSWGQVVNADIASGAAIDLSKLVTQADDTLLANISGGPAAPLAVTLSAFLDGVLSGASNGDLIIRTGGVWARLGIGSESQVLTVIGGVPAWATPSTSNGLEVIAEINQGVAAAQLQYLSIPANCHELLVFFFVFPNTSNSNQEIRLDFVKAGPTVITNTMHTGLGVTAGASFAESEVSSPLDVEGGSIVVPSTGNSGGITGFFTVSDVNGGAYKALNGMATVGGVGFNMLSGQVQDTAALIGLRFTAAFGNVTGRLLILGRRS